jgi:hypothetical protein
MKMKHKFPSKKSRIFGFLLLIVSVFIILVGIVSPIIEAVSILEIVFLTLISGFVVGLFLWCWLATYYVVENENLIVRLGPFVWKIFIKDISLIRLNQKTIGGTWKPTLSWNSIEIKYQSRRSIFVSPENEEGFLERLLVINKAIEIKQK